MMARRQSIGRLGEKLAADELTRRGYLVVGMNYHASRLGEIDIIAREGGIWVFVEVKTRHSTESGSPEEAVTPRKLERLIQSAEHYLAVQELADAPFRIDLAALELDTDNQLKRFVLLKNITI